MFGKILKTWNGVGTLWLILMGFTINNMQSHADDRVCICRWGEIGNTSKQTCGPGNTVYSSKGEYCYNLTCYNYRPGGYERLQAYWGNDANGNSPLQQCMKDKGNLSSPQLRQRAIPSPQHKQPPRLR